MLIHENYFRNIFNTVREAILILDENMSVLSANRSFFTIFKVDAANTIGSLLYDLGNGQWDIPHLRVLLEDILPKNDTVDDYEIEHNFESIGRKTMLLNARKIRETNNDLPIILLAIEDISSRKEIEAGLEKTRIELEVIKKTADEAHAFADSVINTVREPLISLDQDLRVVTVSRSFYEFFKVTPEDTVGQLIYDLGNKQWDIPKLRELLETILPQKTTFDNYEVEHDFTTIGRRTMLLNARQIERVLGKERVILLAIEDITERKEIETGLENTRKELEVIKKTADEAHAFADSVINTVREPLISLDQDLRAVTVSRSFYEFFKVKPEETVGQLIYDLGNKQWDIPKLRELLETILPQKTTFDNFEVEHDFTTIGRRTMLLNARQIVRGRGKERIILLAIEDITEQKRMEDLLTESEERYRRIFETASDGIVLLEKHEGHIVHANPASEKMLGYSEEEYIGKKLQDIGISIDMSDFPAIMQSLNKSGIINYNDVPVKTRSGQDIFTDIYMVDKAKLAQCNIRDVTERKRSDDKLKEEKTFIENALNAIKDVFFVFDLEGRFLRWNKTLNSVTGYLDREIALMKPVDLFRNDDIRRITKAIHTVAKEGSVNVEALIVTKDGRQIPYEFSGSLLSDAHGKSVGISGVGRDLAERRKAEVELELSDGRFKAIFENANDGILLADTETMKFFMGNEKIHQLLGYTENEIKNIGVMDIHPETDLPYVIEQFKKQERGEIEVVADIPVKRKDGSIFYADISSFHIALAGTKYLVGVFSDSTERKQAEEERLKLEAQLRHSQKMEAVGSLAGGIAHDFNNILNVIMGYGNMVYDSIEAGSHVKEQMNEVLIAADKAATLTKRLLVFSRNNVLEVKPVNINALILGLQKMLDRIIRENIDFTLELTDRPLIVLADTGLIEQVLMNLAVNAKDAMQEGGRLTIGTGVEEMNDDYVAAYGYGKPGRYALITVSDTGHGIDAETQKKIFVPFFTTKGIGEGTGLGLAISYGIIKQHDGYINVYSEPGQGTVFKIYLPLTEGTTSPDMKTDAAFPVKGGNETILVTEDDASIRTLLRVVLESFGYCVVTAEDGEDALEKFMENRDEIQLVLLDMIMPKKNGKEVSEAIRKVNPETKILFISGYTMNTIKTDEITEAGVDFIHKPFPPRDLLIKVREVLDR